MLMKSENILSSDDVLKILIEDLKLDPKRVGRNFFFLCPFQEEKTPSFSFEPVKNIFFCFSCNFKSRDVFGLLSSYKNITREEAIKEISKKGYFPENLIGNFIKKETEEDRFKKFLFLVNEIYQYNLFTEKGEKSLDYLLNKRKISLELIKKFSLGCTANNRQISDLLFDSKDKKREENIFLVKSNLINHRDSNNV
jgi:DNA primase